MRTIDKILIQLLVTPTTCATTFGGLSVAFVGWAVDFRLGVLAGLASFLIGIGVAGSRAILNWESILDKRAQAERLASWEQRKKGLDNLNMRLGRNKDQESQALYEELRGLYDAFNENIDSTVANVLRDGIVQKVELLFDGCIQYIEQALQLKKTAAKVRTGSEPLIAQRKELLNEVQAAIVKMAAAVNQTQGSPTGHDNGELDRLRDSLDTQLVAQQRIAQRHPELVRMLKER